MWPDQVSNPGPLTYESGALPTALRGPAQFCIKMKYKTSYITRNNKTFNLNANSNTNFNINTVDPRYLDFDYLE